MSAPPLDPPCPLCASLATEAPLYADAMWHVRHIEPPWGAAGWLVVVARRHVASLAELDDAEAATLGPVLRRCHRALSAATGAERIYAAALGEKVPHLHVHLVPRTASMPNDARGFAVFDLQRAAAAGEIAIDPEAIARVSARFVAALAPI